MTYPSDFYSPEEQDAIGPERMTGWDSALDLDTDLAGITQDTTRELLLALGKYIALDEETNRDHPQVVAALEALLECLPRFDWNAASFALGALDHGQDLYSSVPGQEVLIKFRRA